MAEFLAADHGLSSLYFHVADANTSGLAGGQLRGFSIAVPAVDDAYRTGRFEAVLDGGLTIPGSLELDTLDAPAPRASVSGGGTVCTPATIRADLAGNGPWRVTWSNGVVQTVAEPTAVRSVSPVAATTYRVTEVADVNRTGDIAGWATVTPIEKASIIASPGSTTIRKNSSTTLTVSGTGAAPLTYQWYQGAAGDTTRRVGTNSGSFTTPKRTATTSYRVRVTNTCGPADSAAAVVTVR